MSQHTRRVRSHTILSLFLLCTLLLVGPGSGLAGPTAAAQPAQSAAIKLRAGTFVPGLQEVLPIPDQLRAENPEPGRAGYFIIQFAGPVQEQWIKEVETLGIELLAYIPDFGFKVRMTPEQEDQARKMVSIQWIGLFHPAYKLDPTRRSGTQLYSVRVENGADMSGAAQAVAANSEAMSVTGSQTILVAANPTQVEAIARILDVAWIDHFVLPEKHNEFGAGVIVGSNTANANGYDGSTQIAAVADTGIGGGTAATAHVDVPAGRIVNVYNWPGSAGGCFTSIVDDGAQDVDSGHGTHVALSVLGDGDASGRGKGGAPAASLVFQATENWANVSTFCQIFGGYPAADYFLTGLPANLGDLYLQAYNAGARVHSNSWGAALDGDYTTDSANTDQFIWSNRDMAITFSAGNDGADANNNGVVDNDSIGSPATAKNVITVGASENARPDNFPCDTGLTYTSSDIYQPGQTCSSMGGTNTLGTAGQRWGFTTEPLNSDVTAGNAEQMAPFSSRGPTDDGRIKPDIVAPGTWILSGYSDLYQQGYDAGTNPRNGNFQSDGWGMPLTNLYKYFGGTSMSNPIAAGAATILRDFYQKSVGHNASAALVKATLINSAVDLLDENNDGSNDNDFPIPNVHEGWGRINVANATDGSHQYVDEPVGLGTGGSNVRQFNVATAGTPFKVTLVWSDYPSTEAAAANLVNDLDLTVTAPNGTTIYRGNIFSSGWSQTGGNADRINNVENVYVQSAAAGTWTVTVSGFNVPNGPQPYALVIDGSFGTGPTPTPTNTPVPPTPTPTNTPIGPTATPTNTPVPPTPTNTPVPPTPTPTPSGSGTLLYVSSSTNGNAGGVSFADEDILAHDTGTSAWSMVYDGSDVSGGTDVNAFALLSDGSILLSFDAALSLSGVGSVDDSDIVRFVPTSLGGTTAGSFSLYFDGSDVGLTTNDEDIDAIQLLANGNLIISTLGSFSVTGASGGDEDLVRFTPTNLGGTTSGSWSLYFDGSDVGLNNSASEDIFGISIDEATGEIYITTAGSFAVAGVSGDGADVFICAPGSLGSSTSCTFSPFWDGSANGYAGEVMDGLDIIQGGAGGNVLLTNLTSVDADEVDANDPNEANEGDDIGDEIYLPFINN